MKHTDKKEKITMVKNPKNHREWELKEIEEDSQGYLSAQAAYHEDKERAGERRAYEADLDLFREAFVAAGGDRKDAEAAFKAHRNEQAAVAARQADTAALAQHHNRIKGVL